MVNKHYVLGVIAFLLIPVVVLLGSRVAMSINPEIAAGHPDYERNYQLLELAKSLALLTTFLTSVTLWFLTNVFLLKSKKQSYGWFPLVMLGPFGFVVLTTLRDNALAPWDLYGQCTRRLNLVLRVAYELSVLAAAWAIAYQTIVLKRDLLIGHEAASAGTPVAQIIAQQTASSGMWAFGEGLEELYLVGLFYLLWPVCFNLVGHLPRLWHSSQRI